MGKEMSNGIMNSIYQKINEFLGAGDQLFVMEFPARPLNGRMYEYSTDDRNSVLTKPYTISEAEFRLSDDLYNISPIVQGANGEKLSVVYETLLNNYVPRLDNLKDFVADKAEIRKWLLGQIEDEIDGQKVVCSRIEFCQRLFAKYLDLKNKWTQEKDAKFDSYRVKDDLDGFAKWVSSEGLVRDEQLNNFFNDVVVRGNYHEVLTFLGFLNVSSPAESLESTKQNMRNSVRKSLDASMKVYPVQFQPNNWFKSLKPNFSPKDLTMSTEILLSEFKSKQKQLEKLKSDLAQLELFNIDQAEIQNLEKEVEAGKVAFRQAEAQLIKKYGDGVVTAFKVYLNAQTGGALSGLKNIKSEDFDKKTADALGLAQDVVEAMLGTYKAQSDFIDKAESLTQLQAKYAEANAHDYRSQMLRIKDQIADINADINFLKPLVGGVLSKENIAGDKEDLPLIPEKQQELSDSEFTDIIITTEDAEQASKSDSYSTASHSSWNVSGWFFSAGGSSSSSYASSNQESLATDSKFEIGFRVTKVSIDRGGWFNPNIFKIAHAFQRLAELRAGAGLTKEDIQNAVNTSTPTNNKLASLLKYTSDDNISYNYALPGYPIGFVIAKDITIKISMTEDKSKVMSQYMDSSSSSGGGFLCFSCSNSSSSKSSNQTSYHGYHADHYYIRIPGPQILGWFVQLTPKDNASPYSSLDKSGVAEELRKELQKYDKIGNKE
ncbi:MAG TPA: hypothetical protein VIO64_00140 [Pseudobacteroides sp.]|uniref:coiled-coil domain-containing protein n=1 Tax=Pseudobacteroides sp. TaxID=1968840 RepID=UPI002F93DC61